MAELWEDIMATLNPKGAVPSSLPTNDSGLIRAFVQAAEAQGGLRHTPLNLGRSREIILGDPLADWKTIVVEKIRV